MAANPTENKVMNMMKGMGFDPTKGLGKNKQGITVPVEATSTVGRRGLGLETKEQLQEFETLLEGELESKTVEETPEWLECPEEQRAVLVEQLNEDWILLGTPITKDSQFVEQDRYCPRELIADLVKAKSVFDTVDRKELEAARARANPYETIKAGFFQNRAAMKTANLDKIFGWRLSREFDEAKRQAKNPLTDDDKKKGTNNFDRSSPTFYFADVCAGPGGFSEYMLWRKAFYNAKGIGFTLVGRDDFKLDRFKAAPPEYFETYYGAKEDGDVMDPENLLSLQKFVHDRIGNGVHLVMCDGGFSVDGNENLQEVLSKRLYLCQFIVGLSLCRVEPAKTDQKPPKPVSEAAKGGNFLCKLFDVFTPFSMGLIYLMYCSFERISLHKPITSRPANSERYIFCENLNTFGAGKVLKYLVEVNNRLNAMERKSEDIMELVPDELMQADDDFMQYIGANIEKIARRQIFYLHKYKHFAATPGTYDQDQIKLRNQALHYWELPDKKREEQEMRNRKRNWHQANYEEQKRPESVTDLFDRYSKKQVHFSSKRTEHFTAKVLEQCTDVAEFRALLLPEHVEPVLLISQGANRLLQRRRNGNNFEGFQEVNTTIPKETILLVQCTYLFELKEGKDARIDQVGKCLWVLDAAVLNGDDVSQLDLKARIAAARKFAAAVNRLQIRQNWKTRFSGQGCYNFSEMIVAEPKRLQALVDQQNFVVKNYKGSRMAFFPVWARNDRRDQPPQRYFVACRGVRVQNVLNPNFKLVCENNAETVMPRHAKIDSPNPCTNFYQAFQGYFPAEQLIASYPDGHPLGGAITFHWSWEPDYSSGLNVEDILHKDQHPAGLTLRAVRRLIEERQQKKRTNVAENLQRNNNNYQQQMLVAMKKEEDQEEDGQQSIPPKDAQDNNNRKRDPIGDGEEEEDTDAMGPMAKRRRTSTTEQSAGPE